MKRLFLAFLFPLLAWGQSIAPPVITPAAGSFPTSVTITITDATPGVAIYYTIDGSTPSTASNLYTAPFQLNATATVKAIAVFNPNSKVSSSAFTVTVPPTNCLNVTNKWSSALVGTQTGSFRISYDATPAVNNLDGVMGLSNGPPAYYSSLGPIVRFNVSGFIDAMNGQFGYQSSSATPYTAGATYRIVMDVNVAAHGYNVSVNGKTIATGYAFRIEQASVPALDNMNAFSEGGGYKVCNIVVTPTVPPVAHKVALTWAASPTATWYNVYRSKVKGGPYTWIIGVGSINTLDTNVSTGPYCYTVTSLKGTLESAKSNEICVSVP